MAGTIQIGLVLLAVVAAITMLANRLKIPAPILLVLCGLAASFVPGIPDVQLNPDVVLLLFLPPLVFSAALTTSWSDFRANLRPIVLLAVGLVLFTTAVVGAVAHAVIGLPWAAAFVLGAIIAPPDEVTAIAVFSRLGVPRRILIILEGEGLVNDATSLTLYRFASATIAAGSFSLGGAGLFFVSVVVGEIAFGLFIAWMISWLLRRVEDPSVEITLSVLTPFAAYFPAEQLGGSGVLAVAAAGLYVSSRGPLFISYRTRIQGTAFWDMIVFLLNGLLFLITGLQLHTIFGRIAAELSLNTLLGYGALMSVLVIVLRFVWMYPATYLPRIFSPSLRKRDPSPPWEHPFLVAWAGMRGGISLAAALAIPFTINGNRPFPGRDLIIFLTFFVIIVTLVIQGLSLPILIQWLGLDDDEDVESEKIAEEEARARLAVAEAGLARLDELRQQRHAPPEAVDDLREDYQDRVNHLRTHLGGRVDRNHKAIDRWTADLREAVLAAKRQKLHSLRAEGGVTHDVLRRIEQGLDLEEARWHRDDRDR
jgi:Na+/H+ antiporter